MGRWIKDNWWVALGAVNAALATVLGVGLPFEDRTLGSVVGGIVIAALGIAGVAGTIVRRRPGRRAAGDVMIVLGQLPWLPFFWTIVFPLVSLAVIVAALTDSADASAHRGYFGPPPVETSGPGDARAPDVPSTDATTVEVRPAGTDRVLAVLVVALIGAVAAAVVIGQPGPAYALVSPVVGFMVGHLLFRRRFAARHAMHAGGVLVTGAALSLALLPVGILLVDDFEMAGAGELLFVVDVIAALVAGGVLLAVGVLGRRPRSA